MPVDSLCGTPLEVNMYFKGTFLFSPHSIFQNTPPPELAPLTSTLGVSCRTSLQAWLQLPLGPLENEQVSHYLCCSHSEDGEEFQMKEVQLVVLCQVKQIQYLSYRSVSPKSQKEDRFKTAPFTPSFQTPLELRKSQNFPFGKHSFFRCYVKGIGRLSVSQSVSQRTGGHPSLSLRPTPTPPQPLLQSRVSHKGSQAKCS